MTTHRRRNSLLKLSSVEKKKYSVNTVAKSKPLQTSRPRSVACNTPELGDGVTDLLNVDDDPRGIQWRMHYSSEIRRKSKRETGRGYRIVGRDVNADRDYYETLEWNLTFEGQNFNTYRYWNHGGSFYEYCPDWSMYYSKYADHERYINLKYGGFIRTRKNGARMMKGAPFFKQLVDERGLNNFRGPGHIFEPPWTRRKAKRNKAALNRQRKMSRR